jgi:type II secretory pathway pseudopilin PulG
MVAFRGQNKPAAGGCGLRQVRSVRGFMLVELIVAVSISALLAMYLAAQSRQESEESLAEGSASYIGSVASAAQQHVLLNWNNYANNAAVAGVAVLLQPTVAELVSLGRLNPGFPTAAGSLPTRQSLQVNITRNSCPGAACQVQVLACTTTPVTLGGPDTRFDLASLMMSKQGGTGGQSLQTFGNSIRGPSLNVANPLGNVEGIVCGSGSVDTALFERFLVLNESRNPNFQGPVTIAGPTTVNNNLAVSGPAALAGDTSVGGCAQIRAATGRAGFGCANPDDLPAGYAGGVRAPDIVVNGNVLASTNPAGFTGDNGSYAYLGVSGGVGEIRTSGRAQADRLVASGQYAINSACVAADEGAIARDSAGSGLITCRQGAWRSLANYSAAGAACNLPNGSIADDGTGAKLLCINGSYVSMASLRPLATPGAACAATGTVAYDSASNNEMLVCRLNPAGGASRWMRLRDLTSNLQFVQAYEVTDIAYGGSGQVAKPICSPAAGMSATSLLQLVPKTYASSDGGVAAYAVDIGGAWQIYLRNGSGGLLTGNPNARALANVFCFYA